MTPRPAPAARICLRVMSDGRERPPPSSTDLTAEVRPAPGDGDPAGQHYGALLLIRRTKDDGRELIFFTDTRDPA